MAAHRHGLSPPAPKLDCRQRLREIAESDLRSGDLLFFSSLGVTSFGIRAFSPSSVSHVALYLVNNPKAGAE